MASRLLLVTLLVLAAARALRPSTTLRPRTSPMITPSLGGSALPSPVFIVAIKRPPKGKKAKCTHPKRTGDALCKDCPRRP